MVTPKSKTKSKHKNTIGFGSSVPRFGRITVHPNLDQSGLYTIRELGCDPCRYHPKSIQEVFQLKGCGEVWLHKTQVEDWSKNLGYRNQSILKARRWMKSIGGPAWCQTYVPASYEPACKNVSFGRTARFKTRKNEIPGPGTYYSATPYKVPYGPHSSRPTFEREESCRFKDTVPNWSLAPDRYWIVDKESIEQKSKKIVSICGPYRLFTGKRDGTTIKNHFSDSMKCSASTWPLALPGSFETYRKSLCGTLNKTGRNKPFRGRLALVDGAMAWRSPLDPGPAYLNIDKPKKFVQNRHGFNSSDEKGPGYQRTVVWPAVGRYSPKAVSCGLPGHGYPHVFLSKDERTMGAYLPEPLNSF